MRQAPEFSPPPLERPNPPIVLLRHYRLLTPLFGGGVEAGKVDVTTPIRGTSIRGQLRFWWRATRGGEFGGSPTSMKADESRIWGKTSTASKVTITVLEARPGRVYEKARNSRGDTIPVGEPASDHSYVAFPLKSERPRGDRPGKAAGEVHEGVTFTLRISFPSNLAADVRAALWAWETFGGVGARTRRGFGALACDDVKLEEGSAPLPLDEWRWLYPCESVAARLADDIGRFVSQGEFPPGIPHLSHAPQRRKLQPAHDDALVVWRRLFGKLKEFRQNRGRGTGPRPGRSHWPEPDAIRHLTVHSPLHPDRRPIFTPRIDKFPRADFGLPIVFQFKSEASGPREPEQTQLQGANYDRLASPLILRPLACEGGRAVGLAVILNGPRPDQMPGGLILKGAPHDPPVYATLDPTTEAPQVSAATGGAYNGNPDVLQAFLDTL